jgi:hypothetical protein
MMTRHIQDWIAGVLTSEESGKDDPQDLEWLPSGRPRLLPALDTLSMPSDSGNGTTVLRPGSSTSRPPTSGTAVTIASVVESVVESIVESINTNEIITSRKDTPPASFDTIMTYDRPVVTDSDIEWNEWSSDELALIETLKGIGRFQLTIDQKALDRAHDKWPNMTRLHSVQSLMLSRGDMFNMDVLQLIVEYSADCGTQNEPEAGWNSFVHGHVLKLASKWSIHSHAVRVHNVTLANLKDALIPTINSKRDHGRKVDFTITLQKKSISALGNPSVRRELKSLIRQERLGWRLQCLQIQVHYK